MIFQAKKNELCSTWGCVVENKCLARLFYSTLKRRQAMFLANLTSRHIVCMIAECISSFLVLSLLVFVCVCVLVFHMFMLCMLAYFSTTALRKTNKNKQTFCVYCEIQNRNSKYSLKSTFVESFDYSFNRLSVRPSIRCQFILIFLFFHFPQFPLYLLTHII